MDNRDTLKVLALLIHTSSKNNCSTIADAALPEDVIFPVPSTDAMKAIEEKVEDPALQATLVRYNFPIYKLVSKMYVYIYTRWHHHQRMVYTRWQVHTGKCSQFCALISQYASF